MILFDSSAIHVSVRSRIQISLKFSKCQTNILNITYYLVHSLCHLFEFYLYHIWNVLIFSLLLPHFSVYSFISNKLYFSRFITYIFMYSIGKDLFSHVILISNFNFILTIYVSNEIILQIFLKVIFLLFWKKYVKCTDLRKTDIFIP